MSPSIVLGVDGGNSKTIALAARTDGTVLGAGRAGCSDIHGASTVQDALRELQCAVSGALSRAGIEPRAVQCAAFSMAGADWPDDHRFLEDAVRDLGFVNSVIVVNDALGALRAGSPSGDGDPLRPHCGVVVVVGTGAATGARGPGGTWHHSWWQEPQGSMHLADQALCAVYRADLGIDPPTALTEAVQSVYGVSTPEEVLYARTRRTCRGPDRRGEVTKALLTCAEAGDATAARIVTQHGKSLGDYAIAAAYKVGYTRDDEFPLLLAGGVFRHEGRMLAAALIDRVTSRMPRVCPRVSRLQPVAGALFLALDSVGIREDAAVRTSLTATLPPDSFYAT